MPEFYMNFARKMPEFDNNWSKNILPIFLGGGGHVPPCPSPSSRLLRRRL